MATAQQIRKKMWVSIVAPKLFSEQQIGETYVAEAKEALGKAITVSLMTLTNDTQRQNIHVSFKITEVAGTNLATSVTGYSILPSALRRLVRRERDKFEDSFTLVTKDGYKLRVKPFVVTRSRATAGVLAALMNQSRKQLSATVGKMTYEAFVKELIDHKIQRSTWDALKKIAPLSAYEIKHMSIVGTGEPAPVVEEAPAEVTEEVKEATEEPKEEAVVAEAA